jgi:hypothetical protein
VLGFNAGFSTSQAGLCFQFTQAFYFWIASHLLLHLVFLLPVHQIKAFFVNLGLLSGGRQRCFKLPRLFLVSAFYELWHMP